MTLERLGSYGTVQVDWLTGYPDKDQPSGYSRGVISPEWGTVSIQNAVSEGEFTVQVKICVLCQYYKQ